MTLYDRLPDSVEFDGKQYPVDLGFRKVLAVIDLLEDDCIPDDTKVCLALDLLVPVKHPADGRLLSAITDTIKPERPPKATKQKVLDLSKDWQYIYAGFRQAYGIDLFRDELHWLEFTALLAGLPSDTRMSQIIDIRTKPIPKATKYNQEEIARLNELKAEFALADSGDFQRGLNRLFDALKSQIGRG